MSPTNEEPVLLMSGQRIERSIERMAYQIAEDNPEVSKMLIIGLKKRGFRIARLLAKSLSSLLGNKADLQQLQAEPNGELTFKDAAAEAEKTDYNYILLVDDVIFTGRTMLTAIQKITNKYTPARLRTVILIDRGHRKVPVEATFLGLKLPTKLNEHVSVYIEGNQPEKVILLNK